MIEFAKAIQLAVSVGAFGLIWLIYPGAMAILPSILALCYVGVALGAIRDHRTATWMAFGFSALTAVATGYGVYRFLASGFNYVAGDFEGHAGTYFLPYFFLLISAGATLVVTLQSISRLSGRISQE